MTKGKQGPQDLLARIQTRDATKQPDMVEKTRRAMSLEERDAFDTALRDIARFSSAAIARWGCELGYRLSEQGVSKWRRDNL